MLYLRQMHAAYRRESTVEQGNIRRPVNPWPRYQKESYPRCQTVQQCMYYKAHEVLKKAQKHDYKNILDRWFQREFMETLIERRGHTRTIESAQ